MFDLKVFILLWGVVALFTGIYVFPIMACVYGGAFLWGFIGGLRS